jgi:sugar lactone lactonase YvrE
MDASRIRTMAGGFALSNGMAWSPDGRTLYFSESFDRQVHRFDFDPATGSVAHAGTLASFGGPPKPDGLTVDAEGGIWCAVFGGGCVNRYLPDGTLDRSLKLPVTNPTSCMFGGPDLKTLFVTTASYGLDDAAKAAEPLAGSVFAFSMDVTGMPEPVLDPRCVLLRNAPAPEVPRGLCHV